jgi:hypothetical protein
MFGVIHSTETESGYGSYINLNPHPESSANREGHNGFEGVVRRPYGRCHIETRSLRSGEWRQSLLDGIGDIPLELQATLTPVAQEREFERLGSTYSETHGGRKVWGHKQAGQLESPQSTI